MSGLEAALGKLTCQRLSPGRTRRLLIGRYGIDFTLRAVLEAIGPLATVVIAESVPEIIAWARSLIKTLTAGCVDGSRISSFVEIGAMLRGTVTSQSCRT